MFTTLEPYQYGEHNDILDQMYRLRANVFVSELGWDVLVENGRERDGYDDCNPVYLVWTDLRLETLYGSLRLLPTTGPTLLHDVFHDTIPDGLCVSAPGIWEGTRLCINERALARDLPGISKRTAFCIMLLALCETALKHGIHTLISNYEPSTKRLYRVAGAPLQELGSSNRFGRRPVHAGLFPVDRSAREQMRKSIGIPHTLFLPDINTHLCDRLSAAA